MRKNIHTTMFITALALFLSACSGGSKTTGNTGLNIENCTNGNTLLAKGDKITAETDDTQIRVTHKVDGTKQACVVTGEAKVISPTS